MRPRKLHFSHFGVTLNFGGFGGFWLIPNPCVMIVKSICSSWLGLDISTGVHSCTRTTIKSPFVQDHDAKSLVHPRSGTSCGLSNKSEVPKRVGGRLETI